MKDDVSGASMFHKPILSGVCIRLASLFGIGVHWTRIGFGGFTLLTGLIPGVVLYVLLAVVIPKRLCHKSPYRLG